MRPAALSDSSNCTCQRALTREAAAAQAALCLPFKTIQPRPQTRAVYDRLYGMFKQAYFAFGTGQPAPNLGEILPYLKQLSAGHSNA